MNNDLLKQSLRIQKDASDTFFEFLLTLQSNSKDMLQQSFDSMGWLPSSGKEGWFYWSDSYMKATEKMQAMVEDSFLQAESLFGTATENPPPATKPAATPKKAPVKAKKSTTSTTAKTATKKKPTAKSTRSTAAASKPTTPARSTDSTAKKTAGSKSVKTAAAPNISSQAMDPESPIEKSKNKTPATSATAKQAAK